MCLLLFYLLILFTTWCYCPPLAPRRPCYVHSSWRGTIHECVNICCLFWELPASQPAKSSQGKAGALSGLDCWKRKQSTIFSRYGRGNPVLSVELMNCRSRAVWRCKWRNDSHFWNRYGNKPSFVFRRNCLTNPSDDYHFFTTVFCGRRKTTSWAIPCISFPRIRIRSW